MFVNRDGAMGEGARLLAQDSLRWHIDIFFAYQFFLGFSKEGFRVIVPDLVNSLSPPLRSPDWFLNLLEEKLSYRCCDGCRQTELFVRGAKYKKGGAHVSLLLIAYKFAVFTQGSFFSCERGFKISLTCSSRFGRSKGSSRGPIVEWITLNTYVRFVTKSRFIHLIYRFYNASVNSHSQLSAYSKETH